MQVSVYFLSLSLSLSPYVYFTFCPEHAARTLGLDVKKWKEEEQGKNSLPAKEHKQIEEERLAHL